ncbi:hypothetical protein KY330_02490 [Candidatus Woesearchaeota archaeon]|nr:hypothetical protein [Candidatus Woesearchaeota archaeon]
MERKRVIVAGEDLEIPEESKLTDTHPLNTEKQFRLGSMDISYPKPDKKTPSIEDSVNLTIEHTYEELFEEKEGIEAISPEEAVDVLDELIKNMSEPAEETPKEKTWLDKFLDYSIVPLAEATVKVGKIGYWGLKPVAKGSLFLGKLGYKGIKPLINLSKPFFRWFCSPYSMLGWKDGNKMLNESLEKDNAAHDETLEEQPTIEEEINAELSSIEEAVLNEMIKIKHPDNKAKFKDIISSYLKRNHEEYEIDLYELYQALELTEDPNLKPLIMNELEETAASYAHEDLCKRRWALEENFKKVNQEYRSIDDTLEEDDEDEEHDPEFTEELIQTIKQHVEERDYGEAVQEIEDNLDYIKKYAKDEIKEAIEESEGKPIFRFRHIYDDLTKTATETKTPKQVSSDEREPHEESPQSFSFDEVFGEDSIEEVVEEPEQDLTELIEKHKQYIRQGLLFNPTINTDGNIEMEYFDPETEEVKQKETARFQEDLVNTLNRTAFQTYANKGLDLMGSDFDYALKYFNLCSELGETFKPKIAHKIIETYQSNIIQNQYMIAQLEQSQQPQKVRMMNHLYNEAVKLIDKARPTIRKNLKHLPALGKAGTINLEKQMYFGAIFGGLEEGKMLQESVINGDLEEDDVIKHFEQVQEKIEGLKQYKLGPEQKEALDKMEEECKISLLPKYQKDLQDPAKNHKAQKYINSIYELVIMDNERDIQQRVEALEKGLEIGYNPNQENKDLLVLRLLTEANKHQRHEHYDTAERLNKLVLALDSKNQAAKKGLDAVRMKRYLME